jgi:CheY-like chemotaxis protein
MKEIKVLFVDDDQDDFIITEKHLSKVKRLNFILERASKYEEALEMIKNKDYDVYLIDYMLGVKNGIELVLEAKEYLSGKPVIFLTGQKNNNIDIEAMKVGAADYITKDKIDSCLLERTIRYAINRKNLERKLRHQEELKSLIFETTSAAICLVDVASGDIMKTNSSFKRMFDLEEAMGINFDDFLEINEYSQVLYDHSFKRTQVCPRDVEQCPCYDQPVEVNIKTGGKTLNPPLSCKMSCRIIQIMNGKEQAIRVVTFVDITKQKMAERRLVSAHKKLQDIITNYGLKNKDAAIILSLADLDLDKIEHTEEMKKWIG